MDDVCNSYSFPGVTVLKSASPERKPVGVMSCEWTIKFLCGLGDVVNRYDKNLLKREKKRSSIIHFRRSQSKANAMLLINA